MNDPPRATPSPERQPWAPRIGLLLALAAVLLAAGCLGLATDRPTDPPDATTPPDDSTAETTWHTQLRGDTLAPNTTDRQTFEVPNSTYTLRLGLQSPDGNLTACLQDPSTAQDDEKARCTRTLATDDGQTTWETQNPAPGTWTMTIEPNPSEQADVSYQLTIRHELPPDAPEPRQPTPENQTSTSSTHIQDDATTQTSPPGHDYQPSVVVAVPDSGINPYHEVFHRPELTEHPCTYVQDFPCEIPKLPLSIDEHDTYEDAVEADQDLWDSVEPGTVYWIPHTNIVAAACNGEDLNRYTGCILDPDGHGTGTASSVVTENPDVLLAIEHGNDRAGHLDRLEIPIDLRSVSYGHLFPTPAPAFCFTENLPPIYVTSTGNQPTSSMMDCRDGHPNVITVGGAYAEEDTEEALATKHPDVVSYFCRPTATHTSISEWRPSYCGTSFSTPTVAGALSKVILEVRRSTDYTGSLADGMIDPQADLSIPDLRGAMNRTASYEPDPEYDNEGIAPVPLNPAAPWLQWGWGFYDGTVAETTLAHLLGESPAPEKPEAAQTYMETQHTARTALYG